MTLSSTDEEQINMFYGAFVFGSLSYFNETANPYRVRLTQVSSPLLIEIGEPYSLVYNTQARLAWWPVGEWTLLPGKEQSLDFLPF